MRGDGVVQEELEVLRRPLRPRRLPAPLRRGALRRLRRRRRRRRARRVGLAAGRRPGVVRRLGEVVPGDQVRRLAVPAPPAPVTARASAHAGKRTIGRSDKRPMRIGARCRRRMPRMPQAGRPRPHPPHPVRGWWVGGITA